jgi:proteic killer suppression protein
MRISGFRNRDLDRLWRHNEARGVARQHEGKLRAMLTALEEAENVEELGTVRGWRLHPLKGDRKGVWSLTKNYGQSSTNLQGRRLDDQRDRF